MQYATDVYREEMSHSWRGHSSIYAYIGLVNGDAQRSARITSSFSGSESHLYDGTGSTVTSTENDGHITFTFGDFYELNIAGLMIKFNTVPSQITVTNGVKTKSVVVNDSELTFDEGYENCHYLTITPSSGKLSLRSITFGIGIQLTDRQIISTTRNNNVSHISDRIPSKRFTMTVDNRNHMFSKDNPYGYANYFEEKQVIDYDYGREMDDGTDYKIQGGKVLLKSWTSDDYEATFNCVGYLDFLEGKYKKGKIYPNGISAYDLAVDVLEDAGIENYILDDTMKSCMIFNPVPIVEYREALKMIANASRCTLFEDRDGNICMDNSNRPSYIHTTVFTGAESYCVPSSIFDNNSANNYADAEYDFTCADGTLLFMPDNGNYLSVGFVSSQIADNNGQFSNNPSINTKFKSEFDLKQLFFNFAVVTPTSMTVTCKLQGTVVDTQTLNTLYLCTPYAYSGRIDEIQIDFNGAQPNQRIHLNNIEIDGKIEYEITYHELKNTPYASSLDRVAQINVHSYSYAEEKMEEGYSKSSSIHVDSIPNDDDGETMDVTALGSMYGVAIANVDAKKGDNLVTFNTPYYNYKVTGGKIKESGAYYAIIEADEGQEIDVYAQSYIKTDSVYTVKVHEKGITIDSSNPLISSISMAKIQGEWLRDYYDDDLEYSLTYRGDPILDADDQVYLENKFVLDNEIRLTDESIRTSTGMDFSCRITARRTSFRTEATLGNAVVGRFRVGDALGGATS